MTLLTWDDSFSVGIERIDAQHQRLVKIINLLHDNHRTGNDKSTIFVILAEMREYAKYHFGLEERYMEQYREEYADYDLHMNEHLDFFNSVMDFFIAYTAGQQEETSTELLDYLVKWFTEHTTGTDRGLATLLKSKGVA